MTEELYADALACGSRPLRSRLTLSAPEKPNAGLPGRSWVRLARRSARGSTRADGIRVLMPHGRGRDFQRRVADITRVFPKAYATPERHGPPPTPPVPAQARRPRGAHQTPLIARIRGALRRGGMAFALSTRTALCRLGRRLGIPPGGWGWPISFFSATRQLRISWDLRGREDILSSARLIGAGEALSIGLDRPLLAVRNAGRRDPCLCRDPRGTLAGLDPHGQGP